MANYDVLKLTDLKLVQLNLAMQYSQSNLTTKYYSKRLTYNALHYAKEHMLLKIVQLFVAVDVNHGDKKVQDVHVKVQSVLHNGVAVV